MKDPISRALALADTVEVRALLDPLSPAEQLAVATTIRSIVAELRADGAAENGRLVAQAARVVRCRPVLSVIAGGMAR
jgi:hypothetical protein